MEINLPKKEYEAVNPIYPIDLVENVGVHLIGLFCRVNPHCLSSFKASSAALFPCSAALRNHFTASSSL